MIRQFLSMSMGICSGGSKVGTIRIADTPRSDTARRSSTSAPMNAQPLQQHDARQGFVPGCRRFDSVPGHHSKKNQTRSLVYLCREPRVTEKSGARVPEDSAFKSVSCDIERAPDQKSGCRPARDHSLFEFNIYRLRRTTCPLSSSWATSSSHATRCSSDGYDAARFARSTLHAWNRCACAPFEC